MVTSHNQYQLHKMSRVLPMWSGSLQSAIKMSCLRSAWTSETVQRCSYSLKLWVCLRPVNSCSSAIQTSLCMPSLVVPKMAIDCDQFPAWGLRSLSPSPFHSTHVPSSYQTSSPSSQIPAAAWHWLNNWPLLNVLPPKLRVSWSESTHPKVPAHFAIKSRLTIPYIKNLTHKGKGNRSVSFMRCITKCRTKDFYEF